MLTQLNESVFVCLLFTVFVYSFNKDDKMFQLLTKYLFQTKKLSVPGAGNFAIEAQSAVTDFASQTIEAPGWNILFNQEGEEKNAGIRIAQ